MPPIRANSKDGHGHKDEYLETSRKTLSQEMLMCNMKNIISNYAFGSYDQFQFFFYKVKCQGQKV